MKTIIGFEIHEQIATKTKLYCNSPTNYRDVPPNTNVCEVCTGMPGSKPYPVNQDAIDAAIEIALMLNCDVIKEPIYIQRKHYDYPDLPSGYQRTSLPIGRDGSLNGVGIWEVHLEEDPGKYDPQSGTVDYNRSGVPLVEIVSAPEIYNPEDGRRFLRELIKVLRYTGRVRTEGGTMRTDTNISMEGGARVEIKNINSVKGAYKALKFEITRQKNLMCMGKVVKRETRAFVEAQMITKAMRTKEEAEDYRYIPDPDIPPLLVTERKIASIKKMMPEAPHLKLERFVKDYGIKSIDASTITSEIEFADTFEEVRKKIESQRAANFFRNVIKKCLNYKKMTFKESGIDADQIIWILEKQKSGEITDSSSEETIRGIIEEGKEPVQIVEEKGLIRIKEEDVIEKAVSKAMKENQKAVDDYLAGKEEALHFLLGQVMRLTKNRVDAKSVRRLLKERIAKR